MPSQTKSTLSIPRGGVHSKNIKIPSRGSLNQLMVDCSTRCLFSNTCPRIGFGRKERFLGRAMSQSKPVKEGESPGRVKAGSCSAESFAEPSLNKITRSVNHAMLECSMYKLSVVSCQGRYTAPVRRFQAKSARNVFSEALCCVFILSSMPEFSSTRVCA